MNRKPKPHPVQQLGVYGDAGGGGCFDIAVMQLKPGVGLYHDQQLLEMRVHERRFFPIYMLYVLEVLGHQEKQHEAL